MTYHLECPRSIIEDFKAAAISAFPKEKYAVLLGACKGRRIWIRDVWYPEDQERFATDHSTQDVGHGPWFRKAFDIAESVGLEIVGDIHSHPYTVLSSRRHYKDRSPSESDLRRKIPGVIMGICVVSKSPRTIQVTVKFWAIAPMVSFKRT